MHQKQLDEFKIRLQHAEANERCLLDRINKLQSELSIERTKFTEKELKFLEAKEEIKELTKTVSTSRATEVNIHTQTRNTVFHIHRYTDGTSRQIYLIYSYTNAERSSMYR